MSPFEVEGDEMAREPSSGKAADRISTQRIEGAEPQTLTIPMRPIERTMKP